MGGTYRGVLSPLNKVAIAQTALYVIVAPTVFLIFIWPQRFRPKPTCLLLFIFSVLRLASGIIHLIHATTRWNSEVFRTPAIVFFNVGLVLLLAATTTSIRAVKSTARDGSCHWVRSTTSVLYASLAVAFAFFVVGNTVEIETEAPAGLALARTAYAIIAVNIAAALVVLVFLLRRPKIEEQDRVLLGATTLSVVLILIRTIYGFLFEFAPDPWDTWWNPILGDALSYGLMSMSPEFLALFFQMVPFAGDIPIPAQMRSHP